MSYLRTATYSSERAKLCRSLGRHGLDASGRCTTCGIVVDGYTAPWVPTKTVGISSPRTGSPVGHMVPFASGSTKALGPRMRG